MVGVVPGNLGLITGYQVEVVRVDEVVRMVRVVEVIRLVEVVMVVRSHAGHQV